MYLRGEGGQVDNAIDDPGQDGAGPEGEAEAAPVVHQAIVLILKGSHNACL